MSVRVLVDEDDGGFCFYDTVTETAFGPVISGHAAERREAAFKFLEWAESRAPDVRLLERDEIEALWCRWEDEHPCMSCDHGAHGAGKCGAVDEEGDEPCVCKWDHPRDTAAAATEAA